MPLIDDARRSRAGQRRFALSAVLLAIMIVVFASSGSAASARQRWPVIGCDDFRFSGINHYAWKYAPTGLCSITQTTAGIDHAHWRHWGQNRASARGDYVSDLGFLFPAKITAYGLHVTHNFLGMGTYASWYTKLHVVAKREFRGGILRGPYNVVMNVIPQE